MSATKLPDYRLKQKILYVDKTAPPTLVRYGDLFWEANAYSDALEFYSRAADQKSIQKVQNWAGQEGDVFLFQASVKAQGQDIPAADWETIGRRALELGKHSFARYALEKTGHEDLLKALAAKMKREESKQDE